VLALLDSESSFVRNEVVVREHRTHAVQSTPRARLMSLACANIAESDLHGGAVMAGQRSSNEEVDTLQNAVVRDCRAFSSR
jgi:hypothetical protein